MKRQLERDTNSFPQKKVICNQKLCFPNNQEASNPHKSSQILHTPLPPWQLPGGHRCVPAQLWPRAVVVTFTGTSQPKFPAAAQPGGSCSWSNCGIMEMFRLEKPF